MTTPDVTRLIDTLADRVHASIPGRDEPPAGSVGVSRPVDPIEAL